MARRILGVPVPERGIMFRRRWGHGPSAFGVLISIDIAVGSSGDKSCRGTICGPPRLDSFGMLDGGAVRARDVDLLHRVEAAWVPVFVSRIRLRRPKRRPR